MVITTAVIVVDVMFLVGIVHADLMLAWFILFLQLISSSRDFLSSRCSTFIFLLRARNNRINTACSELQIEKEEEVVEGVVYQYEPPMPGTVDPEQAKIARSLLAVDSEKSSEVGGHDPEGRPSSADVRESTVLVPRALSVFFVL